MISAQLIATAPMLVERMKLLGLISVIPRRPPTTPTDFQAAKCGMTPADYNRFKYEKRCQRAAALGLTPRQLEIRNRKPTTKNKKRK